MKRVLITGSNRGIGLEFTRQYLEAGWWVYATCRRPAEAQSLHILAELHSQLSIHRLDITKQEDLSGICQELKGIALDLLINNAGIYFKKLGKELRCIHYDNWRRTLEVNLLGTVRVTEALIGNIEQSDGRRLVVTLSDELESADDSEEDGTGLYYRSSKAALNAAMQLISAELKNKDIGILLLSPGRVVTRMRPEKGISARQSVSRMRESIECFTMDRSGALLRYDGAQMVC